MFSLASKKNSSAQIISNEEQQRKFVQLVPRRGPPVKDTSNLIRTRFLKAPKGCKNPNLMVYLGSEITKSLDVISGDKISVFYDEVIPTLIFIKKASKEDSGYKLTSKITSNNLVFQFQWSFSSPPSSFYKIREVFFEPCSDGFLINWYVKKK